MICEHCHSYMEEIRSEHSEMSTQQWLKCSLCGRTSLNSQPAVFARSEDQAMDLNDLDVDTTSWSDNPPGGDQAML